MAAKIAKATIAGIVMMLANVIINDESRISLSQASCHQELFAAILIFDGKKRKVKMNRVKQMKQVRQMKQAKRT